nr:hypothetical protein GCM10010200_103450 [Actinomadura rugatobispora]
MVKPLWLAIVNIEDERAAKCEQGDKHAFHGTGPRPSWIWGSVAVFCHPCASRGSPDGPASAGHGRAGRGTRRPVHEFLPLVRKVVGHADGVVQDTMVRALPWSRS